MCHKQARWFGSLWASVCAVGMAYVCIAPSPDRGKAVVTGRALLIVPYTGRHSVALNTGPCSRPPTT